MTLVQCRRCGMVYADPVDAALTDGTFYDERSVPYYLSPEKLESDFAPVRFERELRLFRKFCPRGVVLDVGCSTGSFLFQLKRGSLCPEGRHPFRPTPSTAAAGESPLSASDAYTVTGLDMAGAALDHAADRGIPVIREPFLAHNFGARRFEAITFWAVLEHLAQPREFLRKAATLLGPGGVCFVLVPNLDSLAVRLLGPKYRYVTEEHINYFTAATLGRLAGGEPTLELVAVRSMHFNPVVIWQDWRGCGRPVADAERVRLLHRTTALKQSAWLKPVKLAYRGVERALGALGWADNVALVLRKR